MEKMLSQFKALIVNNKMSGKPYIKNGILYTEDILNEYDINKIVAISDKLFRISSEKANNSFHKSWNKIRNSNIEQLINEQIGHYITTYGFERLGIYNSDYIYIPKEQLDIPEINYDKLELIIIKGITRQELKDNIINILSSGIALKEETIKDYLYILNTYNIELNNNDIDKIKNKEFKIYTYDKLNIEPNDPVEYLRTIIYKLTSETLIIKNNELINKIKESTIRIKYFNVSKLAKIFYRFKPLFLAMKKDIETNRVINKIRKLAKKLHKPLKSDYLNTLTSNYNIDCDLLKNELSKVNIFRKIRIANALKYRLMENMSIVYRIRNGKSYAKKNNIKNISNIFSAYNIICEDIKININNKKVYIPPNIKITLPSSEKQFIGDLPIGSSIEVDSNMIFGVYWENVKNNRIDLDLSLLYIGGKLGWDGSYRNSDRTILFSGDMTDATNGASELYYIQKNNPGVYLAMLNYYNFDKNITVPFKIFIASEKIDNMHSNYMINPENVKMNVNIEINKKQKVLGLIKVGIDKSIFYFCETEIGKSISSYNNKYTEHFRNYLNNYYCNLLSFNDIINISDKNNCDIDLSNITKNKVMELLTREA